MELRETQDQQALRQALRQALTDLSPSSTVRKVMLGDCGHDTILWQVLGRDLGVVGLLVPDEFGGSGGTASDAAVAMEEFGRALACVPFLATAVLTPVALLASEDRDAMARYLPDVAAGACKGALAWAESAHAWHPERVQMAALYQDGTWRLTGAKHFVVDGHESALTLVVARTDAGLSLFAVEGDPPGLARLPQPTMDLTRRLATLHFDQVPVRLIGRDGAGTAVVERVLRAAAGAVAAEAVGGTGRVLEMSVDYAKTRVQFGREIGSFQGIKHRCADMLMSLEMSRSLSAYAHWCLTADDPDVGVATSMAAAYCPDAFYEAACHTVQIHGGLGFTWEHDAHLYLKRAASIRLLFGTATDQRRSLGDLIGV